MWDYILKRKWKHKDGRGTRRGPGRLEEESWEQIWSKHGEGNCQRINIFKNSLKSPTFLHIYYHRCIHRYFLLMDYFTRPALLIFCSGPQAHLCVPRCYVYCLRHLQIDDRRGTALQRQLNGSFSPYHFSCTSKKTKKRKRVGKDKDQTKKCIKNKWWCEPWLPFAQAKHLTVRLLQLFLEVS